MFDWIKDKQRKQQLRKHLRKTIRGELDETALKRSDQCVRNSHLLFPRARLVAVGIAVLFLALAFLSFSFSGPGIVQLGTEELIRSFTVTGYSSDDDTYELSSDVSWQGRYSNELPEGYDEEINLSGEDTTAVSNDGRTIGFNRTGSVGDVMADIADQLKEKGWKHVESGQDGVATFVKDDGVFRWLAITCVAVGDTTSVVVVPGERQVEN